jgi:hypothetical protein
MDQVIEASMNKIARRLNGWVSQEIIFIIPF